MGLAEVKQLPSGNLADVPLLLRRLADHCDAERIGEVVTVCVTDGELDVRGLGSATDMFRSYAMVMQAARFLEGLIRAELTK